MGELTKRQLKTIKMIGRWKDGHCTHSKASITNSQLHEMGLLFYGSDFVKLTEKGKEIYRSIENG